MKEVCEFIIVDGDANREIVTQLGVRSYPTVACYKNGKAIDAQNYRSEQGLTHLVQSLLKN